MNNSKKPMLTSIRASLLLAVSVASAILTGCVTSHRPKLAAMPEVPAPRTVDSVPMGDLKSFPEVKLDIPIAPGPFAPTWASIEKNYPGTPDWLLADEPMTGLDIAHQLDIAQLFRRLAEAEGRGVVVTLHDLTLAARIADRVVVLSNGRVVADGAPDAALTPAIFEQVYGVTARLRSGEAGMVVEVVGRSEGTIS